MLEAIKEYESLEEIIGYLKSKSSKKFDESIDLDIKTGIDSTKQEENMRGTLNLKYGISSDLKILVFAEGEQAKLAKAAGATSVGLYDLIEEIKTKGLGNYDVCLTTNDNFLKLKDIASILGRAGLMPNKKDGTITDDIVGAMTTLTSGTKLLFRNDKAGYIRMRIGKASFDTNKLIENIKTVYEQLTALKPAKLKLLFKRFYLSSTQGEGIEVPFRLIK